MTLALLALQAIVPLGMIAWLAWRPIANRIGFAVHVGATGILIWALEKTGLWLFPPWWTPTLLGLLLVATVVVVLRKCPPTAPRPSTAGGWVVILALLTLSLAAAFQVTWSLLGRTPPPGTIVDLAFPLASGRYLVVNGGNHVRINAHLKTLDTAVARFRAWRGNSYAVDLIAVDRLGLRARGMLPEDPRAYRIHGAAVLAPCDGWVVQAENSLPDQRVLSEDAVNRAGNHVLLRCGEVDVLLAHLRQGSVTVIEGDRVRTGDSLGEVGNSGASGEPHLHVHAQRPGSAAEPFSGTPLPIRLGGRYLVRGDRPTVP